MNKYDSELNLDNRNSLSVLLSRIKPNSMILEFGPANGRMTKYMKEQLNCKVYAVEMDGNAAKDAEKYTERIIVDNIENYIWQEEFKNLKFDYIIFADVLEHLYYPEQVLVSVRDFLKEDASILVSIPNIAHNSIIINLLKNEFNYNSIGLLDNTHIRFFTKKTFDELIEKTGYFTSYESAIFINPENTEFQNTYNELITEVSEYLQSLSCGEIYQFIYEIRKNQINKISDFSDKYRVNSVNFIQLFLEDKNGFLEENSIKHSVDLNNEIQKIEFDLKDKNDIKSLRLDPLNDYCIIKINEIRLNNIIYKDFINTNAFFKEDNLYYFNTDDSQIYISLPSDILIDTFSIEIQYLKIGKDIIIDVSNAFFKIFNEKEQNIQKLNQELENRDKSIENLRNEVNKKEQDIQEKLLDMEILREKIKLYYSNVYNEFFKGLK